MEITSIIGCKQYIESAMVFEMNKDRENLHVNYISLIDWILPSISIKITDLRYRTSIVDTLALIFPIFTNSFTHIDTLGVILKKNKFRLRKIVMMDFINSKTEGWIQEMPLFHNMLIQNVYNYDIFCKIVWSNRNE